MSKKIYDIKPPKVAHKVENTVRSMGRTKKPKAVRAVARQEKPLFRFPKKHMFVGGGIALILLGIFIVTKLPKAQITLWPKLSDLSFQETVTASAGAMSVDVDKKVIPARLVVEQKEGSQEFPASGSASNEGKASGTMKVYNKVSPSTPLTLKAGTHFLSDSGKYFVTLDRIVIPAMKGKTPGSINVKVQAEESGTEYNIGASKFSVPKLSGTIYYYGIWGESTADMTGGYTGTVKKVTQDDIDTASDTLTAKLLAESEEAIRSKLSPEEILLDNGLVTTVTSTTSSVKSGTVANTFTQTAKVTASALVVKKQDVDSFVKKSIIARLPVGNTYLQDDIDVEYAVALVDTKARTGSFQVKATAKTYNVIDTLALVDLFLGANASQIEKMVTQKYGDSITKVDVAFWPLWVHAAPIAANRVKVHLKFE